VEVRRDGAALSVDAQEFAYDNMARMLAKHVDRRCEVIRFPSEKVPAALIPTSTSTTPARPRRWR
jgi:hypothetical protein